MKSFRKVLDSGLRSAGRLLTALLLSSGVLHAQGQEEAAAPGVVDVQGSATVAQIVASAIAPLRAQYGIQAKVITQGGSSGGILAVGAGEAALGMSTRPITGADRAAYPAAIYKEYRLGIQAMSVMVSRDVWEAGVRVLDRKQLTAIYQRDVKNWKELGGPDQAIKFYNTEQGRGPWELFAEWLYGDLRRAPLGTEFEKVQTGEETRNLVEFNRGSIAVAAARWVDNKNSFALGLKLDDGTIVQPTTENFLNSKYPLVRPLLLVSGDRPTGNLKLMLQFMFSDTGQKLVERAVDGIPQKELGELPAF
ncbi:MAG TPA: substrate-binding domain-containing protein [Chthoniobacteraceae bacterium]|jgi:phosphate transport system substrate-binding protein